MIIVMIKAVLGTGKLCTGDIASLAMAQACTGRYRSTLVCYPTQPTGRYRDCKQDLV